MQPDDIDDLFRQQLGGHPTPPSPNLQQRLAELAEAERLDALFRTRLGGHASLPPRALWERLEDEHLRPQPRRRRVVAWWQYSAAAVLLLLLAGGAGLLWRSGYQRPASAELATAGRRQPATGAKAKPNAERAAVEAATQLKPASQEMLAASSPAAREKNQKYVAAQATATPAPASSTPMATTTQPRRFATARRVGGSHQLPGPRPDATTPQLATTGKRKTPAGQPITTSPAALATTVAPAAPRDNPAALVAANLTPSAPPDVIEVDVRRGAEAAPPAAPAVVAAATTPAPRRPRLRLGGLLRQADHLVHGEPASFAEATGLPETVTVQARLGGRMVSKTIQL